MMTHDRFDILYSQLQESSIYDNPPDDDDFERMADGISQKNFLRNQLKDTPYGKLSTIHVTPQEDRMIELFLNELAVAVEAAERGDRGPMQQMAKEMRGGKWRDFKRRMDHIPDFGSTKVIDPRLND